MATIIQLPSGHWRVQVRRKQCYASETFLRHEDARKWATATERRIDLGEAPLKRAKVDPTTFEHLVDLHVEDMREVGKAPRRSKRFTLDALKAKLGKVKLKDLTRERLIQFGKDRSKEGAGPVTLSADLGYLKLVLTHAAAVHGIDVKVEPVDLARVALKRLGLVGKSRARDRRPTADELTRLLDHFDNNDRASIPMGRIVRFAIASAMRQEEICRILWSELDVERRLVLIQDRKDPREKDGNDQWVPLLNLTGFDALHLIRLQRKHCPRGDIIFPYNSRSVGAAFRRACKALKIKNLHFHDLRHEGTSRLFEAGLRIEQVALVTGHRDWKQLKRYTNLRPEHLHRAGADRSPGPADVSDTVRAAAQLLASQIQAAWASQQAITQSTAAPDVTPLLQRLTSLLLDQSEPVEAGQVAPRQLALSA
ncbi:site-specific integrase [Pseudoxanthomonas sp. X-1]|uniref:tyrosine-type recombinase/integrase n=1 Tax=Pseudoxanthomonas sp. X-1 TaxID=2571115 RepID=UPI00110B9670|nr:site-specific integrase [Pseudoxanthomonas sp. X-1]TMN24544.1 site-specific integrase [Pseudoxanthomonas sp. X-1]UAY75187.1 site-specific integrase [Pseudoxanthomonas sp. X-1]